MATNDNRKNKNKNIPSSKSISQTGMCHMVGGECWFRTVFGSLLETRLSLYLQPAL